MLRLQLEAPRRHLERARDPEGGSETARCTDYWWGSAQLGAGGELKEVNRPPTQAKIHKNGAKGGFQHLLT